MLETIGIIVGVIAGLIALTSGLISRKQYSRRDIGEIKVALQEARSERVVNAIKEELATLRASIQKAELPEKQAIEIETINAKIEKVETDLRNFRELLFDNPEATVTIPLIKKDLESLAKDNENLRKEL